MERKRGEEEGDGESTHETRKNEEEKEEVVKKLRPARLLIYM